MNDLLLCKPGEIFLKGLNKHYFEERLVANVKRRLKPIGHFRVTYLQSALYIEAADDAADLDAAYDAVRKVFGIATITRAAACEKDKDAIADAIERYNDSVSDDDKIEYTDIVALLMSSISTIINVISYVLIAFVAISLVVSSIMIGIITYISVLERTKEIGILRAIGASKKDVSRVFNAETFIIGLTAGLIGILMTMLLNIPINIIVHDLTGIMSLKSELPWVGGVILVVISVVLTFFAGLIPSSLAAKKDPVEALRTE